ncbi:conserved hypothetical protein [Neospora caninum Liverpool]|uniref:Aminotransferase, class I/II superfamily protein n=1 Tax=Neospora caninum (strain Liverpool) TaxID=572307 RepID=F0VMV2_NEOCL|nr:conserved hypothetical protein [Neospora caninum Liverpool]CBZ55048.1 conserved hypothetical protein [Neospora caninum Liverpool]CEL69772.1 TPA: aminotransferase, class I/II superfamily protein [Neospora caninum Liverpool]|eukprot:XP_003885076.1 conserved hypothetical protein [Neospora caninum Liverpool]
MPNFVEDFSVTTNGLRTPKRALEITASALHEVFHYPSCDHEPTCLSVATFLHGESCSVAERTANNEEEIARIRKRLVLGNGASELIDLCTRLSCASTWSPGPTDVQYKEYERSATNNGLQLQDDKEAELVCVVNPCNPTEDWVKELYKTRGIKVFVIHSWTKIWACPWSLNTLAIAFLSEVVKDDDYMKETWRVTPQWSDAFRKALQDIRPEWDIKGQNLDMLDIVLIFASSGSSRCYFQAAIVVDALRTPLPSA